MPRIDPALLTAFKNTDFIAELPAGELTISIGVPNANLKVLMDSHGASTAAYITAWNPYSQPTSVEDNHIANISLKDSLQRSGLAFFPCEGRDPTGQWMAEPGFLVLGADRRWLRNLGRRFRQHALVTVARNGRPKLLWTNHS